MVGNDSLKEGLPMAHKVHLVVIDPIPFNGGSKIASETILGQLDQEKIRISVLTADKSAWKDPLISKVHFYEAAWLTDKEQGLVYFLRHFLIALQLLIIRLRFGRIDIALGTSGPGVDLAMYLLKPLLKMKVIQFIHGPVACSRTIARCLAHADQVYYLSSTQDSIQLALQRLAPVVNILPENFTVFENGLDDKNWPSPCQRHYPVVFWAASLLKWKGLDLFLTALQTIPVYLRPLTHICYIKPCSTLLPITNAPVSIANVKWYESPLHMDGLRASANIFVSSSKKEPFGLSILEAMAAGLCVLIPADGAYWDRVLDNNINCIKYQPDDAQDLQKKLLMLSQSMPLVIKIGEHAAQMALHYRASLQYQAVKQNIEKLYQNSSASLLVNG